MGMVTVLIKVDNLGKHIMRYKLGKIIYDLNRIGNPIIYVYRDKHFRTAIWKLLRIKERRIHPSSNKRAIPSQGIKWISGAPHLVQVRPTIPS